MTGRALFADDVGSDMDDDRGASWERFEVLYAEHFRALLTYALRRTAQPANAGDVVAETFLVAWRRIDAVPDDGVRLWLYGVAHRVLANHHRGQRRRERLGRRLGVVLAEHPVADPADAVGTAALVRDALQRLPGDDRELLRLAIWEGLSGPEIAVVLDATPGAVRARLSRARSRLRAVMGDDPRSDGGGPSAPVSAGEGAAGGRPPRDHEGDR